jgi:hypothetical protein
MVTYLPSIITWGDQNEMRYQAVNIATDIEKKLIEGDIELEFQTGWNTDWLENGPSHQVKISYLQEALTQNNHHVFEIKVRWGSDWRTPGEITTKTIVIETKTASP